MSDKVLYTLGYEGSGISDILKILKSENISIVIDVRAETNSRKKGFSKTQLKNRLNNLGIKYIHLKRLGTSKEMRNKLKNGMSLKSFFNQYKKKLYRNEDIIDLISLLANYENCCLLCYERNSSKCHRSILAERVYSKNGNITEIKDL